MANTLSELGEWKDVQFYPMYKISSTGAVMNKRTLKILKHNLPKETRAPSVTLYRCKLGEVVFPFHSFMLSKSRFFYNRI